MLCFAAEATAGGTSTMGPGSDDAYAPRPFASGPGLGPELKLVRGAGPVAVYATTRP